MDKENNEDAEIPWHRIIIASSLYLALVYLILTPDTLTVWSLSAGSWWVVIYFLIPSVVTLVFGLYLHNGLYSQRRLSVKVVLAIILAIWVALPGFYPITLTSQALCHADIDSLPQRIPQRLFIEVSDEWGRVLDGEHGLMVVSSLNDALEVFNFSDRIFPRFDGGEIEAGEEDHAMRLGVVTSMPEPISEWITGWVGRFCGNGVWVIYTKDSYRLTMWLIHELGHYFGLNHEEGTYTDDLGVTHEERFSEKQMEILDRWNHPGEEYLPRWRT